MRKPTNRERLLASTMIGGAVLMALMSAPAYAQDDATDVDEVVITGSRIPQPNLTTTSPVTTIGATDVKLQGSTRIEDVVNNLPQAFAAQGSTVSNGSQGVATLNLRGLGQGRTMVLIDGRRLQPGDPKAIAADINFIPAALVDRIDIVTGGASAVYGADAVGGVVNFILKKDFEGVQIDANYGVYEHTNDDSRVQGILAGRAATNPAQFALPPDEIWEGEQKDITLIMGVNAPDGKGNITAYASMRAIDAILQSQYDYSACAMSTTLDDCAGSSTSFPGRFRTRGQGPGSQSFTIKDSAGNLRAFNASLDQFNFGPYNYFQRPDERYTFGTIGHYQVSDKIEVYGSAMFMHDHSEAQIAPSGIFGQRMLVNCDNPLLSAQEVAAFCEPGVDQDPITPGLQTTATLGNNGMVAIFRRNMEGGGRVNDLTHDDFRIVVGARGDLSSTWSYDMYGLYGSTGRSENYQRDFSLSRAQRALQVVNDPRPTSPTFGTPVCRSVIDGSDINCVPYNIFRLGGVTQAALDYLQVPGFDSAELVEQVVSGSLNGSLGDYGVKSPFADDGVDVAVGAEYRREGFDYKTDAEFQTGDLAGQGGASPPVHGAYSVMEVFGEARIPLVQNAPLAKDLSMNVGYRWSEYTSIGDTNTYKIEGNWTPVDDFRFRASYNRAVRAPNVVELYFPSTVLLDGTSDPCAGDLTNVATNDDPTFTLAQCQAQGVSQAQYQSGIIVANPASQYNGLFQGNPNLKPETADTYTFGIVLTPSFLPGFNLTVDYFDIKITDVIGAVGADNIITQCGLGNAASCALIHRAPGLASLWLDPSGYVVDSTVNSGESSTKGVDVQGNYRFELSDLGMDDLGRLEFNLVGTWLREFNVPTSATTTQACVGLYGPLCGVPRPEWRHRARLTWVTPWDIRATATWRYVGAVDGDPNHAGGPRDATLDSRSYLDLSGSWRMSDRFEFRAGVNNVFDKDPPLIGSGNLGNGQQNGNTAPQVYDALGRYIYMGVTANF